ncbi:MAG: aminopeptidase P family protein [Calditrichia bacterium]|nr:aminopeptidase P family protein [Calditrichia bacterium]
MIREKINQAVEILKEENIDCWLTYVRETSTIPDPAMDLIVGTGVTWQSAFIITVRGETIAIVGSLDKANQESHGYYPKIIGYLESVEDDLMNTLREINPNKIAINYSINTATADGLSHGLYLQLMEYFKNTPFPERLISSEIILNKLRGRKSNTEIDRIKKSIEVTLEMFDQVGGFITTGKSEQDVARFLLDLVEKKGIGLAWDPDHCPAVFTGPDTSGAHAGPTDRKVQPGHVLNIDFGVKIDGYCSDLQRSWYILRDGEENAPEEVKKGFQVIFDSISMAADALKPGKTGYEIDTIAREYIVSQGYEEYPHALGHQIGREAHDGGGLLGPKWERYGTLPDIPVEKSQLFTIEPRLTIKDYGIATAEEIVVITDDGCEFLSARQKEIFLVKP